MLNLLIRNHLRNFINDESGIGTVELILILVEKN